MNENDVAAIAQLFGKPKEEISTAITNGGVSTLVADFTASKKIMTQEDFDKYQENYRQVVINDLVSNKHDLPQAIYEYVKGSVLEKKRKI